MDALVTIQGSLKVSLDVRCALLVLRWGAGLCPWDKVLQRRGEGRVGIDEVVVEPAEATERSLDCPLDAKLLNRYEELHVATLGLAES